MTGRSPSSCRTRRWPATCRRPAIRVEAVGTQIIERISWDQGTITHEPQVLGQAAHLWSRTSLGPADVDVALALRRLHVQRHLVARGPRVLRSRGGQRLARRRASASPSTASCRSTPTAGSSRRGALHGFGFLYEAVLQLRGDAGERQVGDAVTAVVTTGGGTPSGVLLPPARRRMRSRSARSGGCAASHCPGRGYLSKMEIAPSAWTKLPSRSKIGLLCRELGQAADD